MITSETIKEILPKLSQIQQEVTSVHKSATNEHQHYTYATLGDYLDLLREKLAEHDLVLTTTVLNHELHLHEGGKVTAGMMIATRLTHVPSLEWVEIHCPGEGIDHGDKGTYKAITGARKYALALLFNLVTTDDPEADEEVDRKTGEIKPKSHTPAPVKRPAGRPAATNGSASRGNDYEKILATAGLRVEIKTSGKFTNYNISAAKGTLKSALMPETVNHYSRSKDDPYDKLRGLWLPGGVLSFGKDGFEAFVSHIASEYGAPMQNELQYQEEDPADNVGSADLPF